MAASVSEIEQARQRATALALLQQATAPEGVLRTKPLLSPSELRWLVHYTLNGGDDVRASASIRQEGAGTDANRILARLQLPDLAALRERLLQMPGLPASQAKAQPWLPQGWAVRVNTVPGSGSFALLDRSGKQGAVAFTGPHLTDAKAVRISGMLVNSDLRSQGLGAALMQQTEHAQRTQGFERIELSPVPGSDRFYFRLGYRPEAPGSEIWGKRINEPAPTSVAERRPQERLAAPSGRPAGTRVPCRGS